MYRDVIYYRKIKVHKKPAESFPAGFVKNNIILFCYIFDAERKSSHLIFAKAYDLHLVAKSKDILHMVYSLS